MALPSGLIDGMWSNGMKMPSETPRVKALLDLVATERLMYACSNQQTPISEIKEFSQERKNFSNMCFVTFLRTPNFEVAQEMMG